MARDQEHVPCLEGYRFILKADVAAVRMAKADLQAIVEVQPRGGRIRNAPLFT